MASRNRKNPWTSTSEVLLWLLFIALLVPAAFAGYAVGHYTSLGKPAATVTVTSATNTTPTTTPTQATTTAMTTTTSAGGGQIASGKALFASQGCSSCHALAAAGASGQVGPNLDTAIASDAKAANTPLPAFVKQSITNPDVYIAKGYSGGIMPATFGKTLTASQVDDLVALILSGQKP